MRNIITNITLICLLIFSYNLNAQYKSQATERTSVTNSFYKPAPNIYALMSWFNAQNFKMNHNFSLQYITGSGYGMSLATYTNSMFYQISNNLNARMDISLIGSPFGSYNTGNNFNKLFISRVELNYKPWENFYMQLQYRSLPYSYHGYYMPYHWYTSPFPIED